MDIRDMMRAKQPAEPPYYVLWRLKNHQVAYYVGHKASVWRKKPRPAWEICNMTDRMVWRFVPDIGVVKDFMERMDMTGKCGMLMVDDEAVEPPYFFNGNPMEDKP